MARSSTISRPISGSARNPSIKKSAASILGAPAQHNQASRKGKRAWRKNVDIQDVEEGLEGLRAEERVTGNILQKTQDDQLFQIDVQGDPLVRKTITRFSTSRLTSTKILSERSAVPAVFSRPTSTSVKKRTSGVSYEDKIRLLRIAKRMRRGPFNSVMDPTEFGAGSAMLEVSGAVKYSGNYDPWAQTEADEVEVKDGLETVQKKKIKPPTLPHPKDMIHLPAIPQPHQGTSYNPPASAHQELLLQAHEIEERRAKEAERLAEIKAKLDQGKSAVVVTPGVPAGMSVDEVAEQSDEDDVEGGSGVRAPRRLPERKTKQQRRKAAKLLAEKRLLAEKAANKRMLATISEAKVLRRTTEQITRARELQHAQRRLALQEKLKKGLIGQRLGKHKVPEGEVDVQLGEELSESLRALKPEGNLFRDRFLSLQQRALVEPRVPVLPRKRRNKVKEYEKHAWKRFE